MTVRFLALFLMLPASIGWAQHPAERRFASLISESQLRRHVRYLAGLGNRWGGTPSGDKAAEYVASKMTEYGLEVEVLEEPARPVYVHSGWTLRVAKPAGLRRLIRHEWLAGFSPSAKRSTARLVDYEFLESVSALDSAIVLTDKLVTPELYDDLAEKGALAVVSFGPGDLRSYSDWAMITHLRTVDDNPIPLFNISFSNGMRLRKMAASGRVEMQFSSDTKVMSGSPKTIVGTLKGAGQTFRIVCAHGDSDAGGPGADDNASGVAGVLEMARIFSLLSKNDELPAPHESIKFVIWGAEYYSSEHYVRQMGEDLPRISSVINFDEIGTGATRNCIYFESNDIPHNEELLRVLNAVGEDYVGKRGFWEEATTNPSQGGTDSYVFLPAHLEDLDVPEVLIPSVTVFTAAWNSAKTIPQTSGWTSKAWKGHPDSVTIDFSPYYHSSRDIPALTTEKEPFNMTWAVKAVGIALLRLAWVR